MKKILALILVTLSVLAISLSGCQKLTLKEQNPPLIAYLAERLHSPASIDAYINSNKKIQKIVDELSGFQSAYQVAKRLYPNQIHLTNKQIMTLNQNCTTYGWDHVSKSHSKPYIPNLTNNSDLFNS
jgi:hypothetical protein